jgi:Trp operon repressor
MHFELLRRSEAESGRRPVFVVLAVDELLEVIARVRRIPILIDADFIALRRLDEALAVGIAIEFSWPAYAWSHPV